MKRTKRRVLIIVENLPCPFDRRVWQEAKALAGAGYLVSIICPKGKGYDASFEVIDDIHIYRHPLTEADGAVGYVVEYGMALFWEAWLSLRAAWNRGFTVIHACNPPDTIFIIGIFWKLLGKKFIFDHHDINPELFEAKFGKRGMLYKAVCLFERLTFMTADVSIATNESYKAIAVERGRMKPEDVYIVRSGPDLNRLKPVDPDPELRHGREFLVGYVGVMGKQEGIDYLLRSVEYIVLSLGRTDIQFCLVGGGTELDAMRAYSESLGVSDYVTFTGRVPDELLLRVLSTADVCVNPDPVNEMNAKSTMNKIMEYMALKKPIVQFDMKEGRYSARDASLYAKANSEKDFAEKLVELLADKEKRERMGEFGYRRVQDELAWHHQVPILLDAYNNVLRRPRF